MQAEIKLSVQGHIDFTVTTHHNSHFPGGNRTPGVQGNVLHTVHTAWLVASETIPEPEPAPTPSTPTTITLWCEEL